MIESTDLKLISVCLTKYYSLIALLHIFVYERAEFSSISLKCRKVKLSIQNSFAFNYKFLLCGECECYYLFRV